VDYGFYVGIPLALLAIVIWTYRPGAKRRYEADGDIPFDENKKNGNARQGGQ
jgi:cbb3-type cytochrome oxidase subunit 3